jgi:hypothetical protein
MKRPTSRKLALSALPFVVACALAREGDPPLPDENVGTAGEDTGGSPNGGNTMGGSSTGGSSTGGTATGGSSMGGSATGGSATGGSATGGSSTGGSSTGGSSTGGSSTGGSSTGGSATGGSGGMTGGSAGRGGTAGSATGGSGGMTGGSAGKGGTMTGGTGGSPPGGMNLFEDDFEMGTSAWTPTPSGVWATAMDGSTVYAATGASATSTWRAAAAGQTTWTDVDIQARVKITSFEGMSTSYYAAICARYTSNNSYACFALRSQGQVAFRVNGSNEASWNPPMAITTGRWYTVRVVARGANITGYLDGTEIPSGSRVTGGAPASGRLALACPGTNAVFDDVVVRTP